MAISKQMIGHVQCAAMYFSVLALLTGICTKACPEESAIAFHGYGQLICGSTFSSSHNFLSVSNLGYDGDINCGPESLVGAQLDVRANDHITFTAQGLDQPKDRSAPSQPELEIAALTVDYSDDWPTIRIGRQKIPWYLYSPNREVGESYIWVRPPIPVYFEPADHFDGISITRNFVLGNWAFKPIAGYGWVHTDYNNIPASGAPDYRVDYSATHAYGGGLDIYYSSLFRFRVAYFPSIDSITSDETTNLFNLLNKFHQSAAVDELAVDNKRSIFKETGLQFTPGHWNLEAEFIQSVIANTYVPKTESYFISAGYRLGRFTPALTYAHAEAAASFAGLQAIRPNACDFFLKGLCRGYVQDLLSAQAENDRFYELSLRYDVTPHVALKLDFTTLNAGVSNHPSSNLLSSGITFYF